MCSHYLKPSLSRIGRHFRIHCPTLQAAEDGNWKTLLKGVQFADAEEQLGCFRAYASSFLSNVGNYFGFGDQKFLPKVSREFLMKITENPPKARAALERCIDAMLSPLPASLGFPSETAQSRYYPNTKAELDKIGDVLRENGIDQENTRVMKVESPQTTYFVHLASVERDKEPRILSTDPHIELRRGDHRDPLWKVILMLTAAKEYVDSPIRSEFIDAYINHFRTGDLSSHKLSQQLWTKDMKPAVEVNFGFNEPYRDPYGTRAELEGIVAVPDKEETAKLELLVQNSDAIIAALPWVKDSAGDGGKNGPFEKDLPQLPDFLSINGKEPEWRSTDLINRSAHILLEYGVHRKESAKCKLQVPGNRISEVDFL